MQNNTFPQLFFIIFVFNILYFARALLAWLVQEHLKYAPAREARSRNPLSRTPETENTAISLEE